MKKHSMHDKRKQARGFTLLELLVVVGILAIIAGAIVVAYDGFKKRASEAASMSSMKTLTQSILAYAEIERRFPNNVESLLAATPISPTFDSATLNSVVTSISDPVEPKILSPELSAAFEPRVLTTLQVDNLRAAGITQVRFIDSAGNNDEPATLLIQDAAGNTGKRVGPILEASSTLKMFEIPSANANEGNGRGYFIELGPAGTYPSGLQLMVWGNQQTGADGTTVENVFANTLVSAEPNSVLVGLGIGRSSTLILGRFRETSDFGNTNISTAPFDSGQKFNQYQHYIMLLDVTQTPARFVAIVDPNGIPLEQKSIVGAAN